MPASGPVYQPTTVSYEIRPGLLSQTASASPLIIFKKPVRQIILLVFSLLAIAAGKLITTLNSPLPICKCTFRFIPN